MRAFAARAAVHTSAPTIILVTAATAASATVDWEMGRLGLYRSAEPFAADFASLG